MRTAKNTNDVRIFSMLDVNPARCVAFLSDGDRCTQAEAFAIVTADVVTRAEMQQHSMFQTKHVSVKGAEVRAVR